MTHMEVGIMFFRSFSGAVYGTGQDQTHGMYAGVPWLMIRLCISRVSGVLVLKCVYRETPLCVFAERFGLAIPPPPPLYCDILQKVVPKQMEAS